MTDFVMMTGKDVTDRLGLDDPALGAALDAATWDSPAHLRALSHAILMAGRTDDQAKGVGADFAAGRDRGGGSEQDRREDGMNRLDCHWILDGREVREVDLMTWALWFEDADRQIGRTEIAPGIYVSTVFLGINHRFLSDGPPLIFETMTFDDYDEVTGGFDRYATYDEAEDGHARIVAAMIARFGAKTESYQ